MTTEAKSRNTKETRMKQKQRQAEWRESKERTRKGESQERKGLSEAEAAGRTGCECPVSQEK
jgi:hypothetical protein